MNYDINRLKQLSGIREDSTSLTNKFDFNRSKQITKFLIDMSQDLTNEQKRTIIEMVKKGL